MATPSLAGRGSMVQLDFIRPSSTVLPSSVERFFVARSCSMKRSSMTLLSSINMGSVKKFLMRCCGIYLRMRLWIWTRFSKLNSEGGGVALGVWHEGMTCRQFCCCRDSVMLS